MEAPLPCVAIPIHPYDPLAPRRHVDNNNIKHNIPNNIPIMIMPVGAPPTRVIPTLPTMLVLVVVIKT